MFCHLPMLLLLKVPLKLPNQILYHPMVFHQSVELKLSYTLRIKVKKRKKHI